MQPPNSQVPPSREFAKKAQGHSCVVSMDNFIQLECYSISSLISNQGFNWVHFKHWPHAVFTIFAQLLTQI